MEDQAGRKGVMVDEMGGGLGWKRGDTRMDEREDQAGREGGLGWKRGHIRMDEREDQVGREGG